MTSTPASPTMTYACVDGTPFPALIGDGGVLVCVMTSPRWTALFGVAGAVVTDSRAILSHPAIAAREYGIACVVGARGATARIADGALVTVDGAAGTVRIHAEEPA